MKKKILLLMMSIFAIGFTQAQVGINTVTPDQSAALDIVSTNAGLLIPRMTTVQKNAISNPASGLIIYDTTLKCISQNAGTPGAPAWVCLSDRDPQNQFFYMPTIAVDASAVVVGKSINLYNEYKNQFLNPVIKNSAAPAAIPYFPSANNLHYYITSYDDTVLENVTIDDNTGLMKYDVKKESDYYSFMTVVFVLK